MLCLDRLSDSELMERITSAQIELFSRIEVRAKAGTCLKCQGQLVRRGGKHGAFMACSKYPACKYTEKIQEGTEKE
jgi:DNA topoisomerase-1